MHNLFLTLKLFKNINLLFCFPYLCFSCNSFFILIYMLTLHGHDNISKVDNLNHVTVYFNSKFWFFQTMIVWPYSAVSCLKYFIIA